MTPHVLTPTAADYTNLVNQLQLELSQERLKCNVLARLLWEAGKQVEELRQSTVDETVTVS